MDKQVEKDLDKAWKKMSDKLHKEAKRKNKLDNLKKEKGGT